MDPYMIQRPKNNLRNVTQWFPASEKVQDKSSNMVLASVFWDKDGILLVDYLEKGATITA
jgi:hypothetical protein